LSLAELFVEKYVKKLVGRTDMKHALRRLDELTQKGARMAVAQFLKATHAVDYESTEVVDKVLYINNKGARVDDRVVGVDSRVTDGNGRVVNDNDGVKAIDETDTVAIDSAQTYIS
jgi:hypothetical protein